MEAQTLKQNRSAALSLLKLSPQKYNELVFETGISYLEKYLDGNQPLINDFATHRGFWNWWRMQYRIVDDLFNRRYIRELHRSTQLMEAYIQMHLSMDKHIDRVVWEMIEESRDQMIHQLIKTTVSK